MFFVFFQNTSYGHAASNASSSYINISIFLSDDDLSIITNIKMQQQKADKVPLSALYCPFLWKEKNKDTEGRKPYSVWLFILQAFHFSMTYLDSCGKQ